MTDQQTQCDCIEAVKSKGVDSAGPLTRSRADTHRTRLIEDHPRIHSFGPLSYGL
jgi:hypothetical protein